MHASRAGETPATQEKNWDVREGKMPSSRAGETPATHVTPRHARVYRMALSIAWAAFLVRPDLDLSTAV